MDTRHADRIWLFAGAAAIVVLIALSWFLVIGPTYDEADEVRAQSEGTEIQIASLRKRIAELEQQQSKLPQFRRALNRSRQALPAGSGLPDFLRQLQSSGDSFDVEVGGINVSAPELADGLPNVYALPIALTAEGSAENLGRFVRQLQETQPRAVLVESANLTISDQAADEDAADTGEGSSISLALKAFVASTAGAPKITTSAAGPSPSSSASPSRSPSPSSSPSPSAGAAK